MDIQISDQQDRVALSPGEIRKVVEVALGDKARNAEISVVLMDDKGIAEINRQFLQRNQPTDVISFDLSDENGELSGEIIVSTETAQREAAARAHSAEAETLFYIAHGVLHLLGWNDAAEEERAAMLAEQARILKKLGYDVDAEP